MTKLLTIRRATVDDLAEIDALYRRSYPALLKAHVSPSVFVTAVPLLARAQPKLLASGTFFAVTHENGAIVGAGGWTATDPRGAAGRAPSRGHIRHVVTDHRHVRQGIGRALMAHITDRARDAGIARLDCLSTLMAVPFYVACGYEEDGPVSLKLRDGIEFPAVMMHRML